MGLFGFFKKTPNPESSAPTLAETVTVLADHPTTENQHAFYRALLTSKVGSRLPADYQPVEHGQQVTASSNAPVTLPRTTAPDGTTMLLVYCDIPAMHKLFPNERFFELEGRAVLELARANSFGVIVQNAVDGRDSWAGVPKDDVPNVLSTKDG